MILYFFFNYMYSMHPMFPVDLIFLKALRVIFEIVWLLDLEPNPQFNGFCFDQKKT